MAEECGKGELVTLTLGYRNAATLCLLLWLRLRVRLDLDAAVATLILLLGMVSQRTVGFSFSLTSFHGVCPASRSPCVAESLSELTW